MASRMDRYNKTGNSGRSSKNRSLYDEIKNLDTYSNIEGVATIEKTNEIDINQVKNMLKNRESYKKQRKLGLIDDEEEVVVKRKKPEIEEKNYDINEILKKVKEDSKKEDDSYRKLSKEQYDFLKKLNEKEKKLDIEKEEEEIKELINTIKLNNKKLEGTNTDLFDELKSNTMVGDASSIKEILEEEKEHKKELDNTGTMEIDKSFYTSSFGFTKSDFEELKEMNHKIKKSNKFIITLLVILILAIAAIVGYIMFIKK